MALPLRLGAWSAGRDPSGHRRASSGLRIPVSRCLSATRVAVDSARPAVEPVFDALASRVLWVGEAGMGSRLKLATNHWMITSVAALAESMHLCQAMGLDQQQFIALLDGGPLGSAYALQKLDEMRRHQYPAGFPVRLALKDLELVREVEQNTQTTMPLLDAVLERFVNAGEDLADQDLAAIYELDGPAAT